MSSSKYVPNPDELIRSADPTERAVWDALYDVEDPELPISVVDLGLIYDVSVSDGHAEVEMTLTYSGCPAREIIRDDVEAAVRSVPEVESAAIELVYSPPWSYDHITDQGREDLREHGLSVPDTDTDLEADCR